MRIAPIFKRNEVFYRDESIKYIEISGNTADECHSGDMVGLVFGDHLKHGLEYSRTIRAIDADVKLIYGKYAVIFVQDSHKINLKVGSEFAVLWMGKNMSAKLLQYDPNDSEIVLKLLGDHSVFIASKGFARSVDWTSDLSQVVLLDQRRKEMIASGHIKDIGKPSSISFGPNSTIDLDQTLGDILPGIGNRKIFDFKDDGILLDSAIGILSNSESNRSASQWRILLDPIEVESA